MIKPPARHVDHFYGVLASRAKKEGKPPQLTFRGSLVEAFRETGISSRYYSPIRAVLVKTGSIEIVERGVRTRLSIVVLHKKPPPPAEWPGLTGGVPPATITGVDRRLKSLEAWRDSLGKGELNIVEALRNFERRLSSLEKGRK